MSVTKKYKKLEIKKGDSLWLDITGDLVDIDPDWEHWSGKWAIVPTIGGEPLASGNLEKTAVLGEFRFQLSTTDSVKLSVGELILIIQVENSTADYREEILQDKLTVKAQGITP